MEKLTIAREVKNSHEKTNLLTQIEHLEIKADHYSRTDWELYLTVCEELNALNLILLDMITNENETWLQAVA